MPTGYTADVQSGKVTDFSEYAMNCARAFGALVLMRDDPSDAEIPDRFEPSEHYLKGKEKALKALAEFESMSQEERLAMSNAEHDRDVEYATERLSEIALHRSRYEAMLAEAKAYVPPSPDHEKFADFMVKQLTDSIDFDCSTEYYEKQAEKSSFAEWEAKKLESLKRTAEMAEESLKKELERTEGRNIWISQLRESLAVARP